MIIEQIHSIGDLIFLEPMYRHFLNRDKEKPIVPVRNHLLWLSEYIDSASFIPESVYPNYKSRNLHPVLNTMYANQIYRKHPMHYHDDFENCMLDKYLLAGLPPETWLGINLNFVEWKAERLMTDILGYYDGDYILTNTHSQAGTIRIDLKQDELPVYPMRQHAGFTVIDWYMAILYAKEFHTVSTSTFYLLQAMKNKFPGMQTKIFIYPRPNADGLRGIRKLNPSFEYTKM